MQAMSPMFMMLAMFGIFYFVLIRPQVKKQREHQAMLGKLGKGDEVITRGGIVGKITGVAGDVLIIEVQEKVRVRVPRAYIDGRFDAKSAEVREPAKAEAKADAKADKAA
jgi:preprotein translocase subunit YajC